MGMLMMKSKINSQRHAASPSRLFMLWYLGWYWSEPVAEEKGQMKLTARPEYTQKASGRQ